MPRSSRFTVLSLLALGLILLAGCSEERSHEPAGPNLLEMDHKAVPPGYYDGVDASTSAALRATLHDAIDDHTKIPYTSTATDTWNVLEAADQDPNDSGRILDVYLNASYPKYGAGNSDYNREHTWPSSYGFPSDGSSNYPYSDCHHLFLCNDSYNSSRGNKPYGTVGGTGTTEKPTEANDGVGGGSGTYPGWSNWYDSTYWETWWDRRGDVARALFYMDVRYEGGTHGGTGHAEPDLILTDNLTDIENSNTGGNESTAYMGLLSNLLQWHLDDPVDDKERARNDAVYVDQGNRNPFIDHPEWVACVFDNDCSGGDVTPPAAPTGLAATAGDGVVDLDWDDNGETDLAGYTVYRATASGGPYTALNGALLTASVYGDTGVTNGTTYWYVVTATDTSDNESGASGEVSATPQGGGEPPVEVWINEFHYDNVNSDRNEFVEVAGPAGTSLAGWVVYGYNGADGAVYDTVALSGTIADQQAGYGTLDFEMVGMQNGSPDGLALVDDQGAVVQFLSYEGSFTAVGGPADGMTSTDIGIAEPSDTPRRTSLQLAGTGSSYADFYWEGPLGKTDGSVNENQVFSGGGGDTTPPAAPTGLSATGGDGYVDLDWADNGESDLDIYTVYRATSAGGPYSSLDTTTASAYTDNSVTNGTTYWYVVTASDLSANESGYSDEVSATPQGGPSTDMHVDSITPEEIVVNSRKSKGRATVVIVDDQGAPVSGATVTGTFSGDIRQTLSAVTGADGVAVITSDRTNKPPLSFTFCVDDVTASGFTYDSAANVETCDGI